jgi:hypothetical protein
MLVKTTANPQISIVHIKCKSDIVKYHKFTAMRANLDAYSVPYISTKYYYPHLI